LGGNIGGAWGRPGYTHDNSVVIEQFEFTSVGVIGGGQFGCQYQWNSLVFGLEGTYSWANVRQGQPSSVLPFRERSIEISQIGTVAPRLPAGNCKAMQLHPNEIATKIALGAHVIVLLIRLGRHGAKALVVPSIVSLVPLPPRAPELNGQENIAVHASELVVKLALKSFDDIVDDCYAD
jgi:hypothetical protein